MSNWLERWSFSMLRLKKIFGGQKYFKEGRYFSTSSHIKNTIKYRCVCGNFLW